MLSKKRKRMKISTLSSLLIFGFEEGIFQRYVKIRKCSMCTVYSMHSVGELKFLVSRSDFLIFFDFWIDESECER